MTDTPEGVQRPFAEPITIEEPWASAFKRAGLVSPVTDEPSIQQLSKESGVHPSAISRIISGRTRRPRASTVVKLAKALNVEFVEVSNWIGLGWQGFEPWVPPAEASLLDARQRDLVENLIKELLRSQTKNVDD